MEKIRFKDYLLDYLEFTNITQKDFAKKIGISSKHLFDILSGERDITFQVINNIGLVTGISVDYIHRVESNYKLELNIEEYLKKENTTILEVLNKLNYNCLIKENNIDLLDVTDDLEILKDILKHFKIYSLNQIDKLEDNIKENVPNIN